MKFKWKDAAMIKVSAQTAGEVCEELERTVGLTAKNLLDASRAEDAPLHGAFEWNDGIAAEKYRERQATHIINCLCVTREEAEPVRAFFTITRPTYQSTMSIVQTTDGHASLLELARRELAAFQKKYAMLEELAPVMEAIDDLGVSA